MTNSYGSFNHKGTLVELSHYDLLVNTHDDTYCNCKVVLRIAWQQHYKLLCIGEKPSCPVIFVSYSYIHE